MLGSVAMATRDDDSDVEKREDGTDEWPEGYRKPNNTNALRSAGEIFSLAARAGPEAKNVYLGEVYTAYYKTETVR